MSDDHDLHLTTVRDALTNLKYEADELVRYESIHEGGSGSRIYRLWFGAEPLILKVSPATSSTSVREGGYREAMFYRTLAQQLPIATPHVDATWTDEQGSSAVLLGSYLPSEPASRWQEQHYIRAAEQIAQLHAHYWNATEQLATYTWLHQLEGDRPLEFPEVAKAWDSLGTRLDGIGLHQAERTALLTHATRHLVRLVEQTQTFPRTLCHGDCHIANLLRDEDDHLYLADWQVVGIGNGPRDLSFFIQRAMTDGGNVPETSMFETYHAHLEQSVGAPITLAALHQVADAFELHTRLLHWPMYLQMATDDQIQTHLRRIDQILTRDTIN